MAEDTIQFKDAVALLHYYAGKFNNNRFDHWELVNETWMRIYRIKIEDSNLLSIAIRRAMMTYIHIQLRHDHWWSPETKVCSIETPVTGAKVLRDFIPVPGDKLYDDRDELYWLLNNTTSLTDKNRQLIEEHFLQEKSLPEIAKEWNCSRVGLGFMRRKILRLLKGKAKVA